MRQNCRSPRRRIAGSLERLQTTGQTVTHDASGGARILLRLDCLDVLVLAGDHDDLLVLDLAGVAALRAAIEVLTLALVGDAR